jgi:hypothetical protein
MKHQRIYEDYLLIKVQPQKQASAYQLLSQTGVLFSRNLNYKLSISDIQLTPSNSHNGTTFVYFNIIAEVHDLSISPATLITTLEAVGSFSQIYHYLLSQFETICQKLGQDVLTLNEAQYV